MKYSGKNYPQRSKRAAVSRWVFLAIAILIGGWFVFWLTQNTSLSLSTFGLSREKEQLISQWHNEEYQEVFDRATVSLSDDPLDGDYLVLHGFSGFYSGIEQPDDAAGHEMLDTSVISLRKALLLTPSKHHPEIHYVLGKAYFHMGIFYFDAAIHHLITAYDLGYFTDDLFEYIGIAYSRVEHYDEAIMWLKRALDNRFSPLLSLNLSETLFQSEHYEEAKTYAEQTIDATEDSLLRTEAELLIGKAYIQEGDFTSAEQHFTSMIEQGKDIADVRYWLGDVYHNQGKPIPARAEWREAVRMDSQHTLAAARLQD